MAAPGHRAAQDRSPGSGGPAAGAPAPRAARCQAGQLGAPRWACRRGELAAARRRQQHWAQYVTSSLLLQRASAPGSRAGRARMCPAKTAADLTSPGKIINRRHSVHSQHADALPGVSSHSLGMSCRGRRPLSCAHGGATSAPALGPWLGRQRRMTARPWAAAPALYFFSRPGSLDTMVFCAGGGGRRSAASPSRRQSAAQAAAPADLQQCRRCLAPAWPAGAAHRGAGDVRAHVALVHDVLDSQVGGDGQAQQLDGEAQQLQGRRRLLLQRTARGTGTAAQLQLQIACSSRP
jgi:hypothetical protein